MRLWLPLLLLIISASCARVSDPVNSAGPLKVVATTGMIADAAAFIGGDSVEVSALMGPGVDPHLYKATQGDLKKLTNADIILYNGLHLEGKMGEILKKLGRFKTVHAVAEVLEEDRLRQAPGFSSTHDPHIWFNVLLWRDAVMSIADIYSERDKPNAALYRANAEAYFNILTSLESWVRNRTAELPASKRILITAHDAFGYFGDAYGFEVRGLQGLSTLSEFGLKDISDLVNFIVDNRIKAVFVETSVPKRNIDAVIAGCRERGFDAGIGGYLFSDAMGEADTPEGTYAGMVRSNVNTIIDSLL